MRLQEYGVDIFTSISTKSALKKILKKGFIKVNDVVATSATFIKGGECISLSIPNEETPKKRLDFKLKVLFEDDYLALIHKPAGILVSGNSFKTVTNALSQNLKESTAIDAVKPQPVHRLDYATTGVLLIGKTRSSIRILNALFENKKVKKTYYAITIGDMNPQGEITSTIDGKPSESRFTVLDSVSSKRFGKLNLVKLNPKTGRRHQLRKHLWSIGNPILGDITYSTKNLILKRKGLYLHADALEFIHPFTNEKVNQKAELPKKFNKIFPSTTME
ncbi:RluA family pseudouridine synthase [Croceitalea marina]|uniref:RluA family pseudouridine synthase n=1 Tax=Croceitalea marina TaxID=1775166 RepID=A0ABW5MQN8_9FLAO